MDQRALRADHLDRHLGVRARAVVRLDVPLFGSTATDERGGALELEIEVALIPGYQRATAGRGGVARGAGETRSVTPSPLSDASWTPTMFGVE